MVGLGLMPFRPCVGVLAGVMLWLLALPVRAQGAGDIDRLIATLRSGTDFRVRTQAALALGASKSSRATGPLCNALGDSNTTVRAAAAAALGKLQLGGADCLERRHAAEPSQTVKTAIEKALDLVRGGGEPVFKPDTKYYISVGKVSDSTGRSGDGVERMIRKAMLASAPGLGVVIAPAGETAADATRRLASHKKVKALYITPRVPEFDYSDGNLKVRIQVAFFSYPDKALIGNFTVYNVMQGVDSKDVASEDELLEMVANRVLPKLTQIQ